MNKSIRELRDLTNMTQKEFAKMNGIPLATYTKWEQGESTPAPYLVNLIAKNISGASPDTLVIKGKGKQRFFYNKLDNSISDNIGNIIKVSPEIEKVKPENLPIYLNALFDDFYQIQKRFNYDCVADQSEDIIWSED